MTVIGSPDRCQMMATIFVYSRPGAMGSSLFVGLIDGGPCPTHVDQSIPVQDGPTSRHEFSQSKGATSIIRR